MLLQEKIKVKVETRNVDRDSYSSYEAEMTLEDAVKSGRIFDKETFLDFVKKLDEKLGNKKDKL